MVRYKKYQNESSKALILAEDFNHLKNNLYNPKSIKHKSRDVNYFSKFKACNYKEWLRENVLADTRLILEPKVTGISTCLFYKKGKLKKVLTKDGSDNLKIFMGACSIPIRLEIENDMLILGEVCLKNTSKIKKGEWLDYCAYTILNCDLNQSSQNRELRRIGFETTETELIKNESTIDIYLQLWQQGRLFKEFPSHGIILKVNSKKLQRQMGWTNQYTNWGITVKQ